MWSCFLIITQQTSADMRLFTDLDQQGLFLHFCSAWDGSEWQVHEIWIPHREPAFHFSNAPTVATWAWILYLSEPWALFSPQENWLVRVLMFLYSVSKSTKTLPPLPFRLIRCNLKSQIPDSTFSDAIACMFCMAVWIKDWLSLLLSCSNLCPLSLHPGSGEFPKQSGLTYPGRYRLRHFNEFKMQSQVEH